MRQIDYDAYLRGERPPHYKTLSGIELKQVYSAEDVPHSLELPGEYPFTRGIHPDMYRRRLWTRRQQSGYGTPREGNRRFKYLLAAGDTGLNVDFDIAVNLGLDPDHPLAAGDVGLQGTSVATLEDMDELFCDLPLDRISTTLIVQAPYSAYILAAYILVAQSRGISEDKLRGTIMNCPITQLSGPNYEAVVRFFPVDAAVRIAVDVMEYCTKHMPHWNILNINAYNMREMTINAVQEGGWTLSLAADYIRRMLDRGLDIDSFAGRIAVFANVQVSFLEEIAKLRAMRRAWAKMMREKFGAKSLRSCRLRLAVQTGALALTAQQPLNNIVRTTIQTLAAVLAGVQSIHTTAYDEAYALPTEESHKLAVRTQQIIAYETDVAKTVDPLGGSYVIEFLTAELQRKMEAVAQDIEDRGGFIECFKSDWIGEQVNKARYEYMEQVESGERPIIGVNLWREEEEPRISIFRQRPEMQAERREYIKAYKRNRDQERVNRALEVLYIKAREKVNIFPFVLEAVKARATLQEVIDTLRKAEGFEVKV